MSSVSCMFADNSTTKSRRNTKTGTKVVGAACDIPRQFEGQMVQGQGHQAAYKAVTENQPYIRNGKACKSPLSCGGAPHSLLWLRPNWAEALTDDAHLTSDVCLSVCRVHKLRTERPRNTKIGTEVAHVTCQLAGAGAYCGNSELWIYISINQSINQLIDWLIDWLIGQRCLCIMW